MMQMLTTYIVLNTVIYLTIAVVIMRMFALSTASEDASQSGLTAASGTELYEAAERGDVEEIQRLLSDSGAANINSQTTVVSSIQVQSVKLP